MSTTENSTAHETWLNSIGRKRAELIREGEAFEILAERAEERGDYAKAAHYDKKAEEAFDLSREA